MPWILLIVSLAVTTLGVYVIFFYEKLRWPFASRLTIGFIVIIIVTFGTGQAGYAVAHNIAQQSAIGGYKQFLNGTIVQANRTEIACTKNGDCSYEYDCDPYTVWDVVITTDSKGNSSTTMVPRTEYDSCPYATVEYVYDEVDSLGETRSLGRFLNDMPQPWRDGQEIPGNIPRGVPAHWSQAKAALAEGIGLPVTKVGTYENYVLASDNYMFKTSPEDIQTLQDAQLLPTHTVDMNAPVYDGYNARKVNFVGITPSNSEEWQAAVMQLNAALGMQRQGDLHLVVIKATSIPDAITPDAYFNALKAYWLKGLDKNAFPKNGIVVVMGVNDDGTMIEWGRSGTGMPIGNENMIEMMNRQLTNTPFTIERVLGNTTASVKDGAAMYNIGKGIIPQAAMVEIPFKRACMKCKDAGEAEANGFVSLSTDEPVAWWGYLIVATITIVVSAIAWMIGLSSVIAYDDRKKAEIQREKGYARELVPRRGPWSDVHLGEYTRRW